MLVMIGISALIGGLLGLRYTVLVLIPAFVIALLGTAGVGLVERMPLWLTLIVMVLVITAVQIGYLTGIFLRAIFARYAYQEAEPAGSFKLLDIQHHMEVVGSDEAHVGVIDHKEDAQHIVLAGDDPKASGRPHLIPVDWVEYVDDKIHLNKPSNKAVSEWKVAA